jgi:hypothetical protein
MQSLNSVRDRTLRVAVSVGVFAAAGLSSLSHSSGEVTIHPGPAFDSDTLTGIPVSNLLLRPGRVVAGEYAIGTGGLWVDGSSIGLQPYRWGPGGTVSFLDALSTNSLPSCRPIRGGSPWNSPSQSATRGGLRASAFLMLTEPQGRSTHTGERS